MVDDPNNPDDNNQGSSGAEEPPAPYTPGVDASPSEPPMEADPYAPFDGSAEDDSEVLQTTRGSSVAINPGKTILIGIVFLVLCVYGLIMVFGEEDKPKSGPPVGSTPLNPSRGSPVAPPSAVPNSINPALPPVVSMPAPVAPPPPPPPPPPPDPEPESAPPKPEAKSGGGVPPPPPPPSVPKAKTVRAPLKSFRSDEERNKRLRANMMVAGGGGAAAQRQETQRVESQNASTALASRDPNLQYFDNVVRVTHAPKAAATRVSRMHTTIVQGKIIDAVLETAINTDLPGLIRAIVSRDVYAEATKNVLIPKGSRLIGRYNTSVFRGQRRVMIVWTRIVRPDGVDIAIGSPATDAMGRAGVEGIVDNKYMETFSTAILTSILSIGLAYGSDELIDDSGTTTRNTDGSTTTSGSTGSQAAADAVGNIGSVARSVVDNHLDLRPTITIDQGTRINVFVNKDLAFGDQLSTTRIGVFE